MISAAAMMSRFAEAIDRLGSPDAADYERDRIARLREDINAFRRDLRFLDSGGIIVLAPDAAEIDSYIDPHNNLGQYCFPLEDRAKFDLEFARSKGREGEFDQDNATQKVSRRVLRARAHLFNAEHRIVLLPSNLREFDVALNMVLASRDTNDLEEVFKLIGDNVAKLKSNDALLQTLDKLNDLDEDEKLDLLGRIFEKVVANPVVYADDMNLDAKSQRISKIVRANDFLLNAKADGVEDYDWTSILGKVKGNLLDNLQNVAPDKVLVHYLEQLFFRLPAGLPSLSIYTDAQSLAYVAGINEHLRTAGNPKVKVQFVSWALSPVSVARSFWPETGDDEEPLVEVRHPKLLAAAIDFSKIDRAEVEADLDRFSQALSLYQFGREPKEPSLTDESLATIRNAWSRLDNTFLAWATRIESATATRELPVERRRLEEIRQAVADNREAFEDYLVRRIDRLSRELSDSHWAVVQPQNVEQIQAECLAYEANKCIVIRPQTDHARFAIALYEPSLVERINDNFVHGNPFGRMLVELTKTSEVDAGALTKGFRAEVALLKAFLFAVRGEYSIAVRYCQLARSELAQSGSTANVNAEILYLAHYAHRELGKERRSLADFRRCLRRLNESQKAWQSGGSAHIRALGLRYPNSWLTTCREIAASGIDNFKTADWKESIVVAYQSCVDQLSLQVSPSDPAYARLERYQSARAAQNVMFAFAMNEFDVGGWRGSFGDIILPRREQALLAFGLMKRLREEGLPKNETLPKNMVRNDLAFAIGGYLFGDMAHERDQARNELRRVEAELHGDTAMQRATSHLIQKLRLSSGR